MFFVLVSHLNWNLFFDWICLIGSGSIFVFGSAFSSMFRLIFSIVSEFSGLTPTLFLCFHRSTRTVLHVQLCLANVVHLTVCVLVCCALFFLIEPALMLAQMQTYCNYWPLCSWWCHVEHVSWNATLFALLFFCSGRATNKIGNRSHITHENSKHPHNTHFWLTNACDWLGLRAWFYCFTCVWGCLGGCIECWLLLVMCGLALWTHACIGGTCLTMSIVPCTQCYGNATISHNTTTIHKTMCADVDICTCSIDPRIIHDWYNIWHK